jgi:hypothetical protein
MPSGRESCIGDIPSSLVNHIKSYAITLAITELEDLLTRTNEHCDCVAKEHIRERISNITEEINREG